MQDAHRLAEHLQHVEVAIGIERVARIVGGDRDLDAARLHLVQQRDAAPARACGRRGGPADTGCTSAATTMAMPAFGDACRASSPRSVVGLHARASSNGRRAMRPWKPLRRAASAMRSSEQAAGSARLVDMEVEVEARARRRRCIIASSSLVEVGDHEGDGAEHARRGGDAVGELPANQASSRTCVDGEERHRLQRRSRPVQRSRISAKTGQEIVCCGGSESRCVRSATVPCA